LIRMELRDCPIECKGHTQIVFIDETGRDKEITIVGEKYGKCFMSAELRYLRDQLTDRINEIDPQEEVKKVLGYIEVIGGR